MFSLYCVCLFPTALQELKVCRTDTYVIYPKHSKFMSIIIKDLSYTHTDKEVLFSNLNLIINAGEKTALTGNNGCGKSTLMRILAGEASPGTGSVHCSGHLYYVPQHFGQYDGRTVAQVLGIDRKLTALHAILNGDTAEEHFARLDNDWNIEERTQAVLHAWHLNGISLLRPLEGLSGGEKTRLFLAGMELGEPDTILLDEPTNHLDLEMIEWLEGYLKRSKLSLLMVTHDRYFLDRVCSVILELDDCTVYTYKGNYSYYLQKRQERIDASNAEVARANNLYRTELDWMRRMPCARGHKARYREEAFYELEKVAKRKTVEQSVSLEVKSSYIGSKIFEADYISKSYGPDKVILKDFFYTFSRYEKMGIVGNNGTGKSTFIKILLGLVKPDSGRVVVGETVKFGYYSQDGMVFNEQMKVIDAVRSIAEYIDLGGGRHLSAMQFLQHFMFSPKDQQNYVYKLSGGERRRLYLCTVLMQNPNFLVLDEPTNDLDIVTLQVLEEYLRNFKGCVIVVSHDRYFMDKVVDHLLVFQGQGDVRDFPGNYTQYREWQEEKQKFEREQQKDLSSKTKEPPVQKTSRSAHGEQKRKMTFKERREMELLELDIASLESEKKNIEEALCSGALSVEELTDKSKRLSLLNDELDEKSMRWLELAEIEG